MIVFGQQQCLIVLMHADDTTLYCNLDSIPKHRQDIVLVNEHNHASDRLTIVISFLLMSVKQNL